MPLYLIFLTSFLIGFSGAVSPGPLLAVTVEETIRKDFKAGPLIIIGHSILEFLMVLLLVFGFGDFLKKEIIQRYLSIFGGSFLIYTGISIFFSDKKIKNEKYESIPCKKNHFFILKGFFVSLSNPYWSIWWITIGLVYLSFAFPYGFKGIFLFFTGHILSDFLWYSLVSYFVFKSKKVINEKYLKTLSYFFCIFLIFFGMFLIVRKFI
jgi:threonine/homoserine/homoserine lactone efflux protein